MISARWSPLLQVQQPTAMDTRQQLVEDWKSKLAASSQSPVERGERFAWVRQVYARIYRFLVSCYGEGEWRGAGDDSSLNADSQSTASRMPFVECVPTSDGLLPKSPERIRAALESIHGSNSGIATPGTMTGVSDDAWVVVAAQRYVKDARSVRRYLAASRIESRLQRRATDTAILVRYRDFEAACVRVCRRRNAETIKVIGMPTIKVTRIRRQVNHVASVGFLLLVSTLLTFIVTIFVLAEGPGLSSPTSRIWMLWIAGLAAGWLYYSGRHAR